MKLWGGPRDLRSVEFPGSLLWEMQGFTRWTGRVWDSVSCPHQLLLQGARPES